MTDSQPTNVVSIADRLSRTRSTRECMVSTREAFLRDLLTLCRELVEETPGWELFTQSQKDLLARSYANGQILVLAQEINFSCRTPAQ